MIGKEVEQITNKLKVKCGKNESKTQRCVEDIEEQNDDDKLT